MEDINLYIIKGGTKLIFELNDIQNLITIIYQYIPSYSEVNVSNDFFIISKLNKYDYNILLKTQIYNLEDKNFGKIVLIFKKPEKTILDVLVPYKDPPKKRCKFCNKKGHKIFLCNKRIEKSINDLYRLSLKKNI